MTATAAQDLPSGRHVLLVEDNPGDAVLVTELVQLRSPRDEVVHVTTLAAAGLALSAGGFDVVLLDLQLPDGSGAPCVQALRELGDRPAIVVLTGNEGVELALTCLEAGAQDYLSKNALSADNLERAVGYSLARIREARERVRADALQRRLAAVVEASFDAILTCAPNGDVVSWNRGAELIFGYTSDEVIGRRVGDVFAPLSADEPGANITLLGLADGQATELVRRRKDGTPVTLSVVVSRLHDAAGALVGVAAICRDVTQQRSMEVQLLTSDRLVSLGTLAAGVAHEINNPLAALLGNVAVAIQEIEQQQETSSAGGCLEECLRDVRDAAERIRVIVRDLKLFSRPEREERTACDVNRLLDSVARMAWPEVQHSARVIKNYGVVAPVHASEARLSQVFLNLMVNAGQSITPGNVDQNEILLTTRMTHDRRVAIDVRDTGPGIPPEVQAHVFTPFFTTKPVGVGTGLGLAICQRIVRTLGGEIRLESQVGKGTCFTVLLPSADAGLQVAEVSVPVVTAPGRARVMLVDDDPLIVKAVGRVLRRDHDVTGFAAGADALRALAAGAQFDVIVCDVMMPVMTGMAFREALEAHHPTELPKLIFATGGTFTPRVRAFLDTVDHPCVEKPFDYTLLRQLIADLLRAKAEPTPPS